MRCFRPDDQTLIEKCKRATKVLVAAPFYSGRSLKWIEPLKSGSLEFWTRLNPYDWAAGVADPEALATFLRELGPDRVRLRVHRALHAKLFVVDDSWAWVGSPNLTATAFRHNLEVVTEFEKKEMEPILSAVKLIRPALSEMSIDALDTFVDLTKDAVMKFQEDEAPDPSPDMQTAVELADEIIAPERGPSADTVVPPLDAFVKFISRQNDEHSRTVLSRLRGENNLQGHVKQSYYGAALFLSSPQYSKFTHSLVGLPRTAVPQFDDSLVAAWSEFLDTNANVKNTAHDYSFSTLRRILPETWGGYVPNGGGASSTLKRILPLVARFLES